MTHKKFAVLPILLLSALSAELALGQERDDTAEREAPAPEKEKEPPAKETDDEKAAEEREGVEADESEQEDRAKPESPEEGATDGADERDADAKDGKAAPRKPAPNQPGVTAKPQTSREYQPSAITAGTAATTDEDTLDSVSLMSLMETQVVSASKTAEAIEDAPSNIEVITARQIKEWGARDLKDVLRMLPGFPVIPDRDEWVFGARGIVSDNNQKYLILIDGHRMNSWENFGPGNIIELPNDLSNVKRIEIIRGPGSAVWGSDALAGVINVVTKSARDLDGDLVHAQGTVGMNGMYRANAQTGYEYDDDIDIIIMGAWAVEDGVRVRQSAATTLPIIDDPSGFNTHPFGTYETALERRRPSYFLQAKARVKQFAINAYHFNSAVFNRHFEFGLGRRNYLTTDKYFIEGQYQADWEGGGIVAKLWTQENRAEYQPFRQGGQTQLPSNIVWLDRGAGTSLDARHQLTEAVDVAAGVDFNYNKFGPNQRINSLNPADPTVPTEGFWFDPYVEDRQLGGYLQARVAFFDRKLQLLSGARVDYNPDRGEDPANINPRASVIYRPVDITTLKLVYNRGFLRPANFQSAGGQVSSETIDQVELIWMQEAGPFSLMTNLFWQSLEGSINILAGSISGFANSGDYESYGVESRLTVDLAEHTAFVNGSYTRATAGNFDENLPLNSQRVTPDGEVLSFPSVTANTGLTLRFLEDRLYFTPMARFVGEATYRATPPINSLEDATYGTAGPFLYLDATAGFDVNKTWSLSVHGFNLTDERSQRPISIWNGTVGQYGAYVEGRVSARF